MEPRTYYTHNPRLKVNIIETPRATVIRIDGRITLYDNTASTYRDLLQDLIRQGNLFLLINLENVSYIDSTGIGELVSGFTNVTNHGGQLKLCCMKGRVKDLLQITNLYTVFEVYDDEHSGLRSFPAPVRAPNEHHAYREYSW